jgi:hypothetical protein
MRLSFAGAIDLGSPTKHSRAIAMGRYLPNDIAKLAQRLSSQPDTAIAAADPEVATPILLDSITSAPFSPNVFVVALAPKNNG